MRHEKTMRPNQDKVSRRWSVRRGIVYRITTHEGRGTPLAGQRTKREMGEFRKHISDAAQRQAEKWRRQL